MRRLNVLTNEEKQNLIEDYKKGVQTRAICNKYDISAKTIYKVLSQFGVEKKTLVNTKNYTKQYYKICKYCGSKINPIQAIYCCECGKVIVTDRDIVIRKLEKLTNYFIILEHKNRDKYIATINDIIKDVKNLNIVEDGE